MHMITLLAMAAWTEASVASNPGEVPVDWNPGEVPVDWNPGDEVTVDGDGILLD